MVEQLVGTQSTIESHTDFESWKKEFGVLLQEVLGGQQPKAEEAFANFQATLQSFIKQVHLVQENMKEGKISEDYTSVQGRKSLVELHARLTKVIDELRSLIPCSTSEETERGYTKFHLAAHLLQDGFLEANAQLQEGCDAVKHFETLLKHIANAQTLENFAYFHVQMDRFLDILNDLGLWQVLEKGFAFSPVKEEEEKVVEEDYIIFVDPRTGAVGRIPTTKCVDLGLLTPLTKEEQMESFEEVVTDEERDHRYFLRLLLYEL